MSTPKPHPKTNPDAAKKASREAKPSKASEKKSPTKVWCPYCGAFQDKSCPHR